MQNLKRLLKDLLPIYLKGIAMGTADVIPGVSGGTIAFITGIYDDLVDGLAKMNFRHLKSSLLYLAFIGQPEKQKLHKETLTEISWPFFLALGAGILTAILSLAKMIPYLMETYPVETYSLFFGLILVSAKIPFQEVNRRPLDIGVLIAFSLIFFVFFTWTGELPGSVNPFYIFLCGSIAICALVLPGISGAYMLVMLGEYKIVLEALHERNFQIILVFMAGMLVGLFSFIHLLKWLLDHLHSPTMAALTGIMLGSLVIVWPFRYLPEGSEPNYVSSVGLILVGGLVVLWLEYWGNTKSKN